MNEYINNPMVKLYDSILVDMTYLIFWNTQYMNEDERKAYILELMFKQIKYLFEQELIKFSDLAYIENLKLQYCSEVTRKNIILFMEESKIYTYYKFYK